METEFPFRLALARRGEVGEGFDANGERELNCGGAAAPDPAELAWTDAAERLPAAAAPLFHEAGDWKLAVSGVRAGDLGTAWERCNDEIGTACGVRPCAIVPSALVTMRVGSSVMVDVSINLRDHPHHRQRGRGPARWVGPKRQGRHAAAGPARCYIYGLRTGRGPARTQPHIHFIQFHEY